MGRRPAAETGIGPAVVDRLTTGAAADVNERADAGTDVIGSPSPSRLGADGDTAVVEEARAAGVDAEGGVTAGAVGAGWLVLAWRLTSGIAGVVPLGTRRIPPDTGAGRGARPAAAASAAAAARWTAAGLAALAAEVSGRSGTWTAWREIVGIVRIGLDDRERHRGRFVGGSRVGLVRLVDELLGRGARLDRRHR